MNQMQLSKQPQAKKNCAKHLIIFKRTAELNAQIRSDEAVAKRFGGIVSKLDNRLILSRKWASIFILAFYLRLALQAVIIFALYKYNVLQVQFTLILNLFYSCLLLSLRPYESRQD